MNCRKFNDLLHEYRDKTLDAEVQAAAQEHLRQCDDCRRALLREEACAKYIRHSLEHATAGLSLRPQFRRDVLKALESKAAPPKAGSPVWQNFMSITVRPACVGAALLSVFVLFFGVQFYLRTTKNASVDTTAQNRRKGRVVHVPIRAQTYVFQRQNNTVVDAIAGSMAVGHAHFVEDR